MRFPVLVSIFLCSALLIACGSQGPTAEEQSLTAQYNAFSAANTLLVEEHNARIAEVRATVGDTYSYRKAVGAYISFAVPNRGNFTAFANFVRANAEFLTAKGVDTNALLANLDATVRTIDTNTAEFNAFLADTGKPPPIVTTTQTTTRRFETVPMYR